MSPQNFSIQDIVEKFALWLDDAKKHPHIKEYNAFNLATCDSNSKPSNRIVLLKDFSQNGFTFYTNHQSQKGQQILKNPDISMCFYWDPLGRQVRIEGKARPIAEKKSDAYFNSRDYRSRIGACISKQSSEVESYGELKMIFAKELAKVTFKSKIKRPSHWGGFELIPNYFEFWQLGEFRIHKREVYKRQANDQFSQHFLYP